MDRLLVEGTEFGRYRLLDPLGAGAMGEVHRAYDTGTDRVVALKLLSPQFAGDTVYRKRFQREAQIVARLSNPHIVPLHDFGEIDGRLFLDMRLIEAPDLATVLAEKGRLEPATAVHVITQIASALDAAHAHGLLHRDVKPSNILVTPENFAYLIDFGIARGGNDTTLTAAGVMIGTLAYMAPERLTLAETDARSDVYALACVLYECLAGTKPYAGDSVERQIAAHLTDDPPRPSATGLPAAFDPVITTGMAKKPEERYGSAGELAAAAQRALLPPTMSAHRPRPRPRRRTVVAAAVSVLAVTGASALALSRDGSAFVTDAPEPVVPVTSAVTVAPGPAPARPGNPPPAGESPRHRDPLPQPVVTVTETLPAVPGTEGPVIAPTPTPGAPAPALPPPPAPSPSTATATPTATTSGIPTPSTTGAIEPTTTPPETTTPTATGTSTSPAPSETQDGGAAEAGDEAAPDGATGTTIATESPSR